MKHPNIFAVIVMLALVALAGYNYWQINQLRSELAAIKSKVHRGEADSNEQDLLTALASVKEHTARAKEMISNGQMGRARAELDKSLRRLENASALSRDIAADTARGLGEAWQTVHSEIESAWKELSANSVRRRPEGNEPASSE